MFAGVIPTFVSWNNYTIITCYKFTHICCGLYETLNVCELV